MVILTPFLTYELLTSETADPVRIKITGLRERDFGNFKASNGYSITSWNEELGWYIAQAHKLLLAETARDEDADTIPITMRHWPAVKQAIRELNEHYSPVAKAMGDKKEKDMNFQKIDEYNKMVRDIAALVEPVGYDLLVNPDATLTVTRKKPKVKVEWKRVPIGDLIVQGYGYIHIVQFRVTGFAWNDYLEWIRCDGHLAEVSTLLTRQRIVSSFNPSHCENQRHFLYIGLDAREKFSAPVLLPESIFSRLDEITKALEDRANGGKG